MQERLRQLGARFADGAGTGPPVDFGDPQAEWDALAGGCAWIDRGDRASLVARGGDRVAWLHNLVTNEVRNLTPGEGNYAFALDARGRVQFDLAIALAETVAWLDIAACHRAAAHQHFDRYIIMEDVQLESPATVRWALAGPESGGLLARLGIGNAAVWSQCQHAEITVGGATMRCMRHDGLGVPTFECWASDPAALDIVFEAGRAVEMRPVGHRAVETARIRNAIPGVPELACGPLPAETRQLQRAVSFNKGCYLGQEMVERMRARRAVARLLVGLSADDGGLEAGATLLHDGDAVGTVTSVVDPPAGGPRIGLGYVKARLAQPGERLCLTDGNTLRVVGSPPAP